MDYAGGGGGGVGVGVGVGVGAAGAGEVQQPMHHHHLSANHAHPYATPQTATAGAFQFSQQQQSNSLHPNHLHQHSQHSHTHAHTNAHTHTHPHQQPQPQPQPHPTYYADANAAAAAAEARQSLATPSTPSQNASPRFARIASPAHPHPHHHHQQQHATAAAPPAPPAPPAPAPPASATLHAHTAEAASAPAPFTPDDRSLPAMDAADDTFDDAYVQFVLYCNPSFALDTDTAELKRVFRSPPKSDGKSFSTFTLFELLKKLDARELKTWTELALELGVMKPDVERGQSSQKVQQYSVRLKRWMRALHIDAFFEYLMGKKHSYFLAVPPVSDPFPDARDGVPIEEDLAIRAIDPKFRPKRGRRRADEMDGDVETGVLEPKRPHLDTAFHSRPSDDAYPMSAFPASAGAPMSAHPDFAGGADPWASLNTPASALAPRSAISAHSQTLRWRNETPSTPHPLSAVTPMSAHPDSAWDAEPQSAITPSSARSGRRRRHGPAVSSAWPSTNTTANGKLRGRPPSNRSVRDGPFVTFPANPKTKEAPVIELGGSQRLGQNAKAETGERSAESTPTPSQGGAGDSPRPDHLFLTPQLPTPVSASVGSSTIPIPAARAVLTTSNPSSAASSTSGTSQRPERLQLTVPQHVGGPVHLVTPTLLVNGQASGVPVARPPPPAQQTSAGAGTNTASTARTGSSIFSAGASTAPTTAPVVSPQFDNVYAIGNQNVVAVVYPSLKDGLLVRLSRASIKGRRRSGLKIRKLKLAQLSQLADVMIQRLDLSHRHHHHHPTAAASSWLGLQQPEDTQKTGRMRIIIRRVRIDDDGFDSPIDEDDEEDDADDDQEDDEMDDTTLSAREGDSATPDDADEDDPGGGGRDKIRESFDVEWTSHIGGLEAHFAVRGLEISDAGRPPAALSQRAGQEQDAGWKERARRAEAELEALRARVLGAVV